MRGSNEVSTGKAARIEAVLFAGAAFLALFSVAINGPGLLQDVNIGFGILFSGFMWFFGVCYFRGLDPYQLMGLRPSPAKSL